MKTHTITAILFMAILAAATARAEDPVQFADANLKQAVIDGLSLLTPPIITTDPTPSDMSMLERLSAPGKGIVNLTGLEHATRLTFLELGNNQISDLGPLSQVPQLTTLRIADNQVESIAPLANRPYLRELNLSRNRVGDISLLSTLPQMQDLTLPGNGIEDISVLSTLTNLKKLNLNDNHLSSIAPLAGLTNLTNLTLVSTGVGSIEALSNLTNLTYLDLSTAPDFGWPNTISDMGPLQNCTKLVNLFLLGLQIENVEALAGMTLLKTLRLSHNSIVNIQPLAPLAALQKLYLDNNKIVDISVLNSLPNLMELTLDHNRIIDISPAVRFMANWTTLNLQNNQIANISLSGLTNVVVANLQNNQIVNVDISGLPNLATLNLYNNLITNLNLSGLPALTNLNLTTNQLVGTSGVSGLTSLVHLQLAYNRISDISGLSGLTNLTTLMLYNNHEFSDINALSGLSSLKILQLQTNRISDLSPLAGLTGLEELRLQVNRISDVSPLAELTNVGYLRLGGNPLSDISPLTELTHLTTLELYNTDLDWESYCVDIPAIRNHNPGISVGHDPNPYNCNCPPVPTPQGEDVPVVFTDTATGGTAAALTFEQVTTSGTTTLTTLDSGPTLPADFQLGEPPTYYEIATTAEYTGGITVVVSYAGVSFPGPPEALRLFHYEGSQWVDCTTSVNTADQTISGVVTSLSPFAVVAPLDVTPPVFESLVATPSVLWPPNHKMVPIAVTWHVTDNLDANPQVVLRTITMNEGDETNTYDPSYDVTAGDGHTIDDIQVNADGGIFLRAERTGIGMGRTYTLLYQATDALGNTATATVVVTVPHETP